MSFVAGVEGFRSTLLMLAVRNVKNELCLFKRWFQDNPEFIRFESCWGFFNVKVNLWVYTRQGPVLGGRCPAVFSVLPGGRFHLGSHSPWRKSVPPGRAENPVHPRPSRTGSGHPHIGFFFPSNSKNIESLGDVAHVYQHF